ncbi:hypothetical protein FS837_002253 [Tulasnella sp. UAMH 9824]|nr:hypothetical protein FS837_002253 [Tulasnella sp. UAMH 9824]
MMKPPSKNATTQALNILLESIQEENNCTFVSSETHPLTAAPLEHLDTDLEIIRLAKAHLNKKADDFISRILYQRNLAAPIHRLPQEIFEMILENFAADRPVDQEHGLLQLLRVGRLWYHAIVNAPRLWTRLDSTLPSKIARLVIERSKDLPILSFNWTTLSRDKAREEILEMAIQNSRRFKSMELRVSSDDPFDIRPLLEAPTPALESLTVEMNEDPDVEEDEFEEFAVSEGVPLKHLVLHDVSLNFDSPRLSGLITLRLYQSAVPTSLNLLLQVLSATQRLEELTLGDEGWIEEAVAPGPQVTLEHLKELRIEHITNDYCAALLISIYTPICSRVYVNDSRWTQVTEPTLYPLIWQPGNTQTAALLGLHHQSNARALRMPIKVASSPVDIRAHGEEGDVSRLLSFGRLQPWRMVTLLGHFFGDVQFCPPIDLTITCRITQSDPFDLTPWGTFLNRLTLSDSMASLRALGQLARRTAAQKTGERGASVAQVENWICPHLQYITLHSPHIQSQRELHVAALLSLVKKRWSGRDRVSTPAKKPIEFEITCCHLICKPLKDAEIEVKKVIPSFKFRRIE